jgi:Listeria/Bacterioides repeat
MGFKNRYTVILMIICICLSMLSGVVYAKWDGGDNDGSDVYTITYRNLQDATHKNPEMYNAEDLSFDLIDPVARDGWTFKGWYTDSSFDNEITKITTLDTHIIYAKWGGGENNDGPDVYTITYNNLQDAAHRNPKTYTVNDTLLTLLDPDDCTGWTFKGWYLDSDFNNKITEITSSDLKNYDLYAKWGGDGGNGPDEYTIIYRNLLGATHENIGTYTVENMPLTLLAPDERIGWTFNGWYLDEAFNYNVAILDVADLGNFYLYAKWGGNDGYGPDEYTIGYVDPVEGTIVGAEEEDGEGEFRPMLMRIFFNFANFNVHSYNVESVITLYDLEKTGYTFNGWFDNKDFAGEAITTFGPGEIGDKTFYADWTRIDRNGGTGTSRAITVSSQETEEPPQPVPAENPKPVVNDGSIGSGKQETLPQPPQSTIPRFVWLLSVLSFLVLVYFGFHRYGNSKMR